MDRLSRRSVLRAAGVAGVAATGGCVSLTAGTGVRRPGTLIATNRADRARALEVRAAPESSGPTRRTTVRLDAGARRVHDGFVASAGRYAIQVRAADEGGRVLGETTAAYERDGTGALRGGAIRVTVRADGGVGVATTD